MESAATDRRSPIYIEIARHAVKGPFSASTRATQIQCLLACSVFLLAWFNLVAISELAVWGAKLTVSLRVVGGLALVYALYQLARFISEALLELQLYELEFEPIRTEAAAEVDKEREDATLRATAFRAALDEFGKRVEENRAAYAAREARIAEIEAEHKPKIDALRAEAEAFGPPSTDLIATPEGLARARARSDAYEAWFEAANALRDVLRPLREEPLPHPEMDESHGLVSRSFRVWDMPSTELILKAMKASRQRGRLVALLDIALPILLFAFSVGVLLWSMRPAGLFAV